MPVIQLSLRIAAPPARCFDLARSIDLHRISTPGTDEEAVAGCTTGLIELHETVTWRARHFGVWQHFTSRITAFAVPHHFRDEMVKGAFRSLVHDHYFEAQPDGSTLMRDIFAFESPGWVLGRLVNRWFLTPYLTRLLQKRNETIRAFAESERWREVLLPARTV